MRDITVKKAKKKRAMFSGRVTLLRKTYGFVRPVPCFNHCALYFQNPRYSGLEEGDYVVFSLQYGDSRAHDVFKMSNECMVEAMSNESWVLGRITKVKGTYAFAHDEFCNAESVFVPSSNFVVGDEVIYIRMQTEKGTQAQNICVADPSVVSYRPPSFMHDLGNCRRICKDWFNAHVVRIEWLETSTVKITFSCVREADVALYHWNSCNYEVQRINRPTLRVQEVVQEVKEVQQNDAQMNV